VIEYGQSIGNKCSTKSGDGANDVKRNRLIIKKAPRRSGKRRGDISRTLLIEVFFFLAFLLFGFSAVSYWLGSRTSPVVSLVPGIPNIIAPREQTASMLYEAPSPRQLPEPSLSPIFMPSVQYWKDDLLDWGAEYNVDPNLIATVMQIESCGNPEASSGVGAKGLFQVMPFHFATGEKPYDPATNALRGIGYLAQGLQASGGHAGLAMAGYNGGLSVIARSYDNWPYETQRYYRWGSGIYREASAGWDSSPTLTAWLAAGGQSLCDRAEAYLGLTTAR
jgi:hypothetical protein